MPLLIVILALAFIQAQAEEFSGEAYFINPSVANNGTSSTLPSRYQTATAYLEYPGDFGDAKTFRLELATLPLFSDLSQVLNGAFSYALDDKTHINIFGETVTTPDIPIMPLLRGTPQDRLNDPGFRPAPCDGCNTLRDVVYLVNLNFMRKYDWEVPRIDIGGRPIPVQFSAGATTKYYYEELEGGDYIAQNMNMDLGLCMKAFWGYDPVTHQSDRDIKIQFSGFELLPTKQESDFGGSQVFESMDRRWRYSVSWEEGIPDWGSTVSVGVTQKSEQSQWPGAGLEWDFQDMLFLRAGFDQDYLSAGASIAYRWLSIHYAFRHHELGTSLYQVSAQVQWP